jgi:hypothetical protein
MMERIRKSLIFERVLVWDNSTAERDAKTAGRYEATALARTPVVYYQDDDVIVPASSQEGLLAAFEPGVPTAAYGHGATPAGYDDLPLVCGGALVDRLMPLVAADGYLAQHPHDDDFDYYCDFAIGVLYPVFKHVRLPFEIVLSVAQHPSRLVNQPFAAEMKQRVTERARDIRDGVRASEVAVVAS